jgi:hypothetical protein
LRASFLEELSTVLPEVSLCFSVPLDVAVLKAKMVFQMLKVMRMELLTHN